MRWAVEPCGDYPHLWPLIAASAKKRAGWCCEHCGMEFIPGSNLARYSRNRNGRPTILTVHHLNGDKSDCSYRNLLVCCQRCHLRIQRMWGPGDPLPPLWADAPEWMRQRGLDYQPREQLPCCKENVMRIVAQHPRDQVDYDIIIDLLGLVNEEVASDWLRSLSDQEIEELTDWAAREYLAASDNLVKRTARPACLEGSW